MRIAIIGSYPDYGGEIGGISMHIKRLRSHLLARGHRVAVYTLVGKGNPAQNVFRVSSSKLLPLVMLGEQDALVHMHVATWRSWALGALIGRFRFGRTLLTLHGIEFRQQWEGAGAVGRAAIRAGLRQMDHVVAVNDNVARDIRMAMGSSNRLSVIPAFVPAVPCQQDRDRVPASVWDFVRTHEPVISMNGWITWFQQTTDLYGFDLMLYALRDLLEDYPTIGVVAALCGIMAGGDSLWEQTRQLTRRLGLEDHVCWANQVPEYYPILEVSRAMLRPTWTDGWPLSIGEAMSLGVPVIASDVSPRPPGTILFRTGDAGDLADKIRHVLAADRPVAPVTFDYHLRLIDLYERLQP